MLQCYNVTFSAGSGYAFSIMNIYRQNLNIIFFAYCQTKPQKVHTECILFVR